MSFKVQLLRETEGSDLNFDKLLQVIEDENIPMFNAVLSHNMLGLARNKGVYIDILRSIQSYNYSMLFFVILHEIGHYKRMASSTEQDRFYKFTQSSYSGYVNYVIDEEIFADRYGRLLYYIFNNKEFPIDMTQQLEKIGRKIEYRKRLRGVFKHINKNLKTVEEYNKFLDNFIVHVR